MVPDSIRLRKKWCAISMCLVHGWNSGWWDIAMAAWLSVNKIDVSGCGISSSLNNAQCHKICLAVLETCSLSGSCYQTGQLRQDSHLLRRELREQTGQDVFSIYTHACLSTRSCDHYGNCRTLAQALPSRLHVPPLTAATPSLWSQLYVRREVYTRHQCLTLTLAHVPQEACPWQSLPLEAQHRNIV
jgi:hypothetical protein